MSVSSFQLLTEPHSRSTTISVVPCCRGVARAVALASRLDPYDRIDERRAGVGCWAGAKASVTDIAPVAPLSTDALAA
jgi:hypothetical protein